MMRTPARWVRPKRLRRSRRSSAIVRTTFPRSTAVLAAHAGCAAQAADTAAALGEALLHMHRADAVRQRPVPGGGVVEVTGSPAVLREATLVAIDEAPVRLSGSNSGASFTTFQIIGPPR